MTALGRHLERYDVLVLTAVIWFLAKFLRYAFPPLFGPFQETYGVSNAVLGMAFTGFLLVYAAMQFPSGVLADRIGSVTVISVGVVCASLASLSLVVDAPFAILVGAMLVLGAGTGVHKTVAVRLLARTYPTRTGRVLGILDTVGTFGGVVAPAAVVVVLSYPLVFDTGWRALFLIAGLCGLVLGAAFFVRVPRRLDDDGSTMSASSDASSDVNTTEESTTAPIGLTQYVVLFREWRFVCFVIATILFSFTYNGFVAFVPLYLTAEAGFSTATAGILYSALFAVSVVQLVTGEISDRVGTLPVIVAALGTASAALIVFVGVTGTASVLGLGVALVLVGVGSHGFRPVRGAYLMAVLPETIAGGSLGIVRTLLMGAGALAPAIVGSLSETVGFRPAFWLLAGSVTLATCLCTLLFLTASSREQSPRTQGV